MYYEIELHHSALAISLVSPASITKTAMNVEAYLKTFPNPGCCITGWSWKFVVFCLNRSVTEIVSFESFFLHNTFQI